MRVDEAERRAQIRRYWEHSGSDQDISHEIYHEDAVLEFPQSGGEGAISYDGGPWQCAVNILEFRGDKVDRETIYVTEPWDAPEWRARWRAAP